MGIKSKIFHEDGCEIENVRMYTEVHNLKDIACEMYLLLLKYI